MQRMDAAIGGTLGIAVTAGSSTVSGSCTGAAAAPVQRRFHLLKNLRETIARQLGGFEAPIRASATEIEDDQDAPQQPTVDRSDRHLGDRGAGTAQAPSPRCPPGFRASGLSLITAAIDHWNTVYLDRVVQHLRAQGGTIPDDLLAHSPLSDGSTSH